MKNKMIKLSLFIGILFSTSMVFAQNDSAALAAADTTHFSVNAAQGWQLYNSYAGMHGADSIQLEIIVKHANNINWSLENYVGKISTGGLFPSLDQTILFNLMANTFSLRIDTQGKCYLKLLFGVSPADNPAVIPINLVYKK